MAAKINYIWNIEELNENDKKDIKERIETKISEIPDYINFNVKINKNPKGGADILITYNNDKLTFEGIYQDHHILGVSILWADNPLPAFH